MLSVKVPYEMFAPLDPLVAALLTDESVNAPINFVMQSTTTHILVQQILC